MLAQKQRGLPKPPPTPTPTEKSATPNTDEPDGAAAVETDTPPRAATPLERTLLELLSDADLGATGFLKANELKAVLTKLGKVRKYLLRWQCFLYRETLLT